MFQAQNKGTDMAKRYIEVKYQDKDLAKRLGARWDASTQRWYCPSGSQLDKIFKWRAEAKMPAHNMPAQSYNSGTRPQLSLL